VVQSKVIIEIYPCTGAFLDSLTVVHHIRKGVPSRTHTACFNTGKNINMKLMSSCEWCCKTQLYKHKKLLYIYSNFL